MRHVDFGEGDYGRTESLIRRLLVDARPALRSSLPAQSGIPDSTPMDARNPETYLGYDRIQYLWETTPVPDTAAPYEIPGAVPLGEYALSGTWTIGSEDATAGPDARLELGFEAKDIYLVLGGTGTVEVSVNGAAPTTISVGALPGLYTLLSSGSVREGVLTLTFSRGVQAYDFTFG